MDQKIGESVYSAEKYAVECCISEEVNTDSMTTGVKRLIRISLHKECSSMFFHTNLTTLFGSRVVDELLCKVHITKTQIFKLLDQ